MFAAFDRKQNGQEVDVTEVDIFGNTPDHGKLNRVFIYNGPMWAVWAHRHPETALFK
jgi:hypothetical protein